jgi:hypothetical protein
MGIECGGLMADKPRDEDEQALVERLSAELAKVEPTTRRRLAEKFLLAALGSIPWVGGFLSAAASFKTEEGAVRQNTLQTEWLKEHEKKPVKLREALEHIYERFESIGSTIDERIQSDEYLQLVRKAFRVWDDAETEDKRGYVANIVVNSAGTRVCTDDVVRLFIDWLALYHESHFAVIREIFKNPGATRFDIWSAIYGDTPREDSAEADLFKLLIRDLSTGGVIRQDRETNYAGRFLRRSRPRRTASVPSTMESAFEDTKPYVLTELGKQFVHYTMNEVVGRLEEH